MRPKSPSALSFLLLTGSSLRCRRVATALPRKFQAPGVREICLGLRPEHRSASAEFYSGHSPPLRRLNYLADQARRRIASSGCRSGSCVSVGLRLRVHVARARYCPVREGMCRLPAGHTFPAYAAGFPPTNTEAWGIVPTRMFAFQLRLLEISPASPPLPLRLGLS